MEICSGDKWNSHTEICYEGGSQTCPVCEALALIAERDIEIKYYEKEIAGLNEEIETLNEQEVSKDTTR